VTGKIGESKSQFEKVVLKTVGWLVGSGLTALLAQKG